MLIDDEAPGILLLIGGVLILAALIGTATYLVITYVVRTNRPADEAFRDGLEVGRDKGHREQAEECRRNHIRVVRHINDRSLSG
jgi:hypothetical protein